MDSSIVSAITLLAVATLVLVLGIWVGARISPLIQRQLDRADADEETGDRPA